VPWMALLDIGSTYTKGVAVDAEIGEILASVQMPSSVDVDVGMGVNLAMDALIAEVGAEPVQALASSSARGGLGVIAIGLVPRLTVAAARQAALGAGAKLLHAFGHQLTLDDLDSIKRADPDIVLLCGGTDGGDQANLVSNAQRLADNVEPGATVVVAGNRTAGPPAAELLERAGWRTEVLPNVLPEIGVLHVEPVREALRRIFLDRITRAKGIDAAARQVGGVVMATPAAVLAAGELLSGVGDDVPAVLGDLLIVDVGGATTDIVSSVHPRPADDHVYRIGLPEPVVKRTVEGDLGLRHNARTIVERFGLESAVAQSALSEADILRLLDTYEADPARLPVGPDEFAFDTYLARTAIQQAALRHAGTLEEVRIPHQPSIFRISGKDLRPVRYVIGTGGCLTRRSDALALLTATQADPAVPESLRPTDVTYLVDRHYALFGCGLLAEGNPELARRVGAATLGVAVPA
jgi:uncharacterized protein (TIGR01319 family)